jgi:hypothetical protein
MPKAFLNDLGMDALGQQQCGRRMSQVVNTN